MTSSTGALKDMHYSEKTGKVYVNNATDAGKE